VPKGSGGKPLKNRRWQDRQLPHAYSDRNCVNFTAFAAAGRATVNKLPKIPRPRRAPRGFAHAHVERRDECDSKSARSTLPHRRRQSIATTTHWRHPRRFEISFGVSQGLQRTSALVVTSSRHQRGDPIVSRKATRSNRRPSREAWPSTDFDNARRLRFMQQITHR
jgi:hypothetical protein